LFFLPFVFLAARPSGETQSYTDRKPPGHLRSRRRAAYCSVDGSRQYRFRDEMKPRADDRVDWWFGLRVPGGKEPAKLNVRRQEFRLNI
jgi:hypothetical protein